MRRHGPLAKTGKMLLPLCASAMLLAPRALRADVRDDRWRQDLSALATQLTTRHPNPYFTTKKADFDRAVADLDAAIPTLPDSAVVVGLMRVAALIGDGHTQILIADVIGSSGMRLFPWQLYWFEGGLYVVRTTPESAAAQGARVLTIGGRDVTEVERLVATAISHENEYWVHERSPYYMVVLDVLQALEVLPAGDRGTFLLEAPDGRRFTLELPTVTASAWNSFVRSPVVPTPAPLYLRHPELYYWYEYRADERVLYFQYNVCREQAGRPLGAFTNELLSFVDSHPVDRMIFDLRNNTGGNSGLIAPLLTGLANRGIFSSLGRSFVIIGRATFSSGLKNSIDLRKLGAPALGEPTGGKPNGYGEVLTFNLPNSDILVRHSTRAFTVVAGDPIALFPDVAFPPRASEFFGGKDPVVDAVVAGDHAPTAAIAEPAGDRIVDAGAPVSFTGSGSDVDPGDELTYTWTFGDGGTATGRVVRHSFPVPGNYAVVLTVRDLVGAAATASVEVTVVEPRTSGNAVFLPVVLDVHGEGGSHYRTELTLLSRASVPVTVSFRYTAAAGGGTGFARETLAPGELRVVPDAIALLRSLGLALPDDGTGLVGTLEATFAGASSSEVFLGGRTYTPGSGGTFGLFYSGARLGTSTASVAGLQENAAQRSNLALQNGGPTPITLRVQLFGPTGADLGRLDDQVLEGYGFVQLNRPLLGKAEAGRAVITRLSGTEPFHAYGVLNDAITSDGSYIPPLLPSDTGGAGRLVPVVLDALGLGGSHYTTELTLANGAGAPLALSLDYAASLGSGSGSVPLTLAPGEQKVIPNAIEFLRVAGLAIPGDGSSVGGSLLIRAPNGTSTAGLTAGARTFTPAASGGGTFGLYYPGLADAECAQAVAWINGLRQDGAMRSNLAIVNRGDGGDAVTLRVTYFGPNGTALGAPDEETLRPGEWRQLGQPLASRGAEAGYAKVEKLSGTSRFVAYGVLNDAATSDGSYIAMTF